jgi:nucleotide-binding universal stress UspA family protein
MQPFKSILVDIDASMAAHPALDRAVRLARASGAKLMIADVVTIPSDAHRYLEPSLEEEYVMRRRRRLEQVARGVAGVPTESTLLSGRPATALIREVLRAGHDLLIRSHARGRTARSTWSCSGSAPALSWSWARGHRPPIPACSAPCTPAPTMPASRRST